MTQNVKAQARIAVPEIVVPHPWRVALVLANHPRKSENSRKLVRIPDLGLYVSGEDEAEVCIA